MLVASRAVKGLALGPIAFPIALMLGLLARAVGEPGFGTFAAFLLVTGIASGAGEAMSELVDASDRRPAARAISLGLALTALMLYVAGGGIPPVSGLVLLGGSIAARGLGRAEELLTLPATIRRTIVLPRPAEDDAAAAA
jgi:hypothetical protein